MRADGSHVRRLATLPAGFDWDGSPAFPRRPPTGVHSIHPRPGLSSVHNRLAGKHNPDHPLFHQGRGCRLVTKRKPDRLRSIPEQASTGDVYVVNADGKHLRNLTHYAPQERCVRPGVVTGWAADLFFRSSIGISRTGSRVWPS